MYCGRHLVRRVRGAGRHVEEVRLVGGDRPRPPQPGDRLVHQVRRQDVVRIGRPRHELVILVQRRLPLIHVAAHEAVEVVEAQPARPAIERPDLARLPVGRVVVLAEPRGGVAVLPQHLGDRADVLADDAGVAVVAGGGLGDHAVAGRVVIASGEQRGPRRRAERRRVEARVAQPVGRHAVERRRRHLPAERAELTVAGVVDQDVDDVRRALGRPHRLRKLRRIALGDRAPDAPLELEIGKRQHLRRRHARPPAPFAFPPPNKLLRRRPPTKSRNSRSQGARSITTVGVA